MWIVFDQTREMALAKAREALREFIVQGVKTTIPLHQRIMESPEFISGNYNTKFLEEFARA
jgi:acetyl-CoA carboxylase biotin carboxylase subunit